MNTQIARASGFVGIAIGFSTLIGWILDIPLLHSITPKFVGMKESTAVTFILLGISIVATHRWFYATENATHRDPKGPSRSIALVSAALVLIIGAVKIIDHASGTNYIDGIITVTVSARTDPQMALITSVNFVLLGGSMLLFYSRLSRAFIQMGAGVTLFVSLIALNNYIYGVQSLYSIAIFSQMALHTAFAFIVCSVGICFLQPNTGIMKTVNSDTAGGHVARILLPAAFLIPPSLGWLRWIGQQAGLYGTEFGLSLMVIGGTISLVIVTLLASHSLYRTDVAKQEAEEQMHSEKIFSDTIINSLPGIFFMFNGEGKFIQWNRNMEFITGYDTEELRRLHTFDLVSPSEMEMAARKFAQAFEQGKASLEFQLVTKEKACIPFYATGVRLTKHDERYIVGTGIDISERVAAEQKIRNLNLELEQRVVERTAQLTAANKELEAFSYSVSHDLRTPLRSIDGFSQALEEDYDVHLDATAKNYIQRIRAATQRMAELIDDLLQLSRITRSEVFPEFIDLTEIAWKIAEEISDADAQRSVEWRIEENVTAFGDARLLKIALTNLFDNAWKFTSKKSHALIEFGMTNDYGHKPEYFVRDNGAGFDRAHAQKLFAPFQRFHSLKEFPGTGIGLATVQRIMHKHNGTLRAESSDGNGASFYFTFY